jgi:hypothetical protein
MDLSNYRLTWKEGWYYACRHLILNTRMVKMLELYTGTDFVWKTETLPKKARATNSALIITLIFASH